MFRKLDASGRNLPPNLERQNLKVWQNLNDYFIKLCHHGCETSLAEFEVRLLRLEIFLLDRLRPKTFEHLGIIDDLM